MLQIFQLNRYHQKEIFHILLVIEIYLVFGGCCDVWKFIRMLITTTEQISHKEMKMVNCNSKSDSFLIFFKQQKQCG